MTGSLNNVAFVVSIAMWLKKMSVVNYLPTVEEEGGVCRGDIASRSSHSPLTATICRLRLNGPRIVLLALKRSKVSGYRLSVFQMQCSLHEILATACFGDKFFLAAYRGS